MSVSTVKKIKSLLPVLESFSSSSQPVSTISGSPVYIQVSVEKSSESRSAFCVNDKVDIGCFSVELRV